MSINYHMNVSVEPKNHIQFEVSRNRHLIKYEAHLRKVVYILKDVRLAYG